MWTRLPVRCRSFSGITFGYHFMQLGQLKVLCAIAETGSIRAAARTLGLSQPSVTKSLRVLEQDLDVVLVHRSSQGIVLTEAGRALLPRARGIQAEVQKAREDMERLAGRARDSVTVGVASVIGAWLVPPVLTRHGREHPGTIVRVIEGTQETLLPMLRDGSIDFAVCLRLDDESTSGFTVRALARFRLTVVGRKGHPLRSARSLQELGSAHWIMTRPRGKGGVLEQAFRAEGLSIPRSAAECDSHAIKISTLAQSDALALVAKPMLNEPAVAALLEEIPLSKPLPLLTAGLYTRSDVRLAPACRALSLALEAECKKILRLN
ncbi:LysR substrate-binding domain-containing protein [Variovorax sp. RA8]|uniref:LysR substrate-binding domain-containing protein n=1 Tax=Variovorax sp. (strain JCM 16519 / RA8) TaxID=662548 RepID=UPI000AA98C0B|nr:LysR substrate-binding domain-containing protein [Variovorax sp. RA8]